MILQALLKCCTITTIVINIAAGAMSLAGRQRPKLHFI